MVEHVVRFDAKGKVVLVAGVATEEPGCTAGASPATHSAAHHDRSTSAKSTRREPAAAASSAVGAALIGAAAITGALVLTLLAILLLLPLTCRLRTVGEVVGWRPEAKCLSDAHVDSHGARTLSEIPLDDRIAGFRIRIEHSEVCDDRARIAWVCQRGPVAELRIAIVVPACGDVERTARVRKDVRTDSEAGRQSDRTTNKELIAHVSARTAELSSQIIRIGW